MRSGPMVVGALGGSGTRVVAQILGEVGVHIGTDLNPALDNRWFTLLFKRPSWYRAVVTANPGQIRRGLDVLTKAMAGAPDWTDVDRRFIRSATLDMAVHGHDHKGNGRGLWAFKRSRALRSGSSPDPDQFGWGWKEPNSHVYLPQMIEHFPDLRFIYVVRHGLDMAYSPNQSQFRTWGPTFDIEVPSGSDQAIADAMLAWWASATRRAVDHGRALGDRFFFLDYDALCADPAAVLPDLLDFLGAAADRGMRSSLADLPRVSETTGRYRTEAWRDLHAEGLDAIREYGFALED